MHACKQYIEYRDVYPCWDKTVFCPILSHTLIDGHIFIQKGHKYLHNSMTLKSTKKINCKEWLLMTFMQKWSCIVSQLGITYENYALNKSLFIWLQGES